METSDIMVFARPQYFVSRCADVDAADVSSGAANCFGRVVGGFYFDENGSFDNPVCGHDASPTCRFFRLPPRGSAINLRVFCQNPTR